MKKYLLLSIVWVFALFSCKEEPEIVVQNFTPDISPSPFIFNIIESTSPSEIFIESTRSLNVGWEQTSVTLECTSFENINIDWKQSITSDFRFIEENDTIEVNIIDGNKIALEIPEIRLNPEDYANNIGYWNYIGGYLQLCAESEDGIEEDYLEIWRYYPDCFYDEVNKIKKSQNQ